MPELDTCTGGSFFSVQGEPHSHPGQWKCELQQFLLQHTDILWGLASARPVNAASDGDSIVLLKENVYPIGKSKE